MLVGLVTLCALTWLLDHSMVSLSLFARSTPAETAAIWGCLLVSALVGILGRRWGRSAEVGGSSRGARALLGLGYWVMGSALLVLLAFPLVEYYAILVGPAWAYALIGTLSFLRQWSQGPAERDPPS